MILRVAGAFAALAFAVPVTPQEMPGETQVVDYPLVHQVRCTKVRGTAFRIGRTDFATAAHVAANYGCTVEDAPFTIISIEGRLDAARINVPIPKLGAIEISCEGFRPGEWYYSIGYANGEPRQLLVPVYAIANRHVSGMQLFIGKNTFIPGMSGGPVLDSLGRAVGIVNAYNAHYRISFSRAFKDTDLC